jgi:Protein of unknown function (DUF2442)
MHPRVSTVHIPVPFRVMLTFTDGSSGEVDLAPLIFDEGAGVFAALRDPALFAQVNVDREAGTICWPNDLDLDPDVLYETAMRRPMAGHEGQQANQ